MSKPARLYIGSVIAAGFTVLIAASFGSPEVAHQPWVFAGLVVATIATERFVMHLPFRNEVVSFSLAEIIMTFGLFTMPARMVVLAVAGGMLLAQTIRRRPLVKTAFNTGMYALAMGAAASVFALLRSPEPQQLRTYLAALAAMGAFFLVNKTLVSLVVTLVEGRRFREVASMLAGIIIAIWGGNVALGMLAARLYFADPSSLPLLIIPATLAFAAYRASVRSKVESRKMHELYIAGSALITSMENADAFEPFLAPTRDLFRATGAQIVLAETPRELRICRDDGSVRRVHLDAPLIDESDVLREMDARIRSAGWRSWLTAPIFDEGKVTGMLVVHDRRGPEGPEEFPERERDLVRLLADELSIRIRNIGLLKSVSEERSKLKDIVDHTTDGIYQTGPDRRIVSWNQAMETITGYPAAEAIGQYCFNILRATDGAGTNLCTSDCPILQCCRSSAHQERESEIMTKDGQARWIGYSHSPVRNADGTVISDVVVVRDVSEQKRLREVQEDFLSTVSHELRTPLTPLKGFLMTLRRPDANLTAEDTQDIYDRMLHQAERLEDLVDDLLAISHLEFAATLVAREPVDVASVVRRAVRAFEGADAGRRFLIDAPDSCFAVADERRLEQAVSNLLQNAVRYSDPSEPVAVSVGEVGGHVQIAVRDQGVGIAVRDQERIFERFYRCQATRHRQGTGLGLYIVRRFLDGMGGRVSVTSRLGKGSTFVLHLSPVAAAAPAPGPALTIVPDPVQRKAE